ncbi:MAG: hypothetical protein ACLU38_00040 [Dysosmobacter sp.]
MRKRVWALAAALLMLPLTGCGSLLNRDYSVTEPHSSSYYESEDRSVLRAGELSGSGECPAGADQRRGQGGNHLALPRRQWASRPAGGGAGVSGGAEGDAAGSLRRGVP